MPTDQAAKTYAPATLASDPSMPTPRLAPLLGLVLLLAAATPLLAAEVVLTGATVHTVSGDLLTPGEVHVIDGVIAAVGASVEAPEATRVDLSGHHLYPGLIAPTSSLGLAEINAVRATRDTNEVGAFTPEVESWIAVNPDSTHLPVARANGITHALVVPLGGVVSGQSGILQLSGWTWEDMSVRTPAALHVHWPSMDLRLEPPRRRPPGGQDTNPDEGGSPEEQVERRAARVRQLLDFFESARAYHRAREAGEIPLGEIDPLWESMRQVVAGELPIFVHADEIRQIRTICDWIADERAADGRPEGWPNVVLVGARDAALLAERLAELAVPVIFEHIRTLPPRDTDDHDVMFTAPARLHAAGVEVSISLGTGAWNSANQRNLPYHAARAHAFGLPANAAIRAITLHPARALGIEDRLGSIEPGREATLIATDGDLLDIRSNVQRMWIAGEEQSLESRHTKLYERYRNR